MAGMTVYYWFNTIYRSDIYITGLTMAGQWRLVVAWITSSQHWESSAWVAGTLTWGLVTPLLWTCSIRNMCPSHSTGPVGGTIRSRQWTWTFVTYHKCLRAIRSALELSGLSRRVIRSALELSGLSRRAISSAWELSGVYRNYQDCLGELSGLFSS